MLYFVFPLVSHSRFLSVFSLSSNVPTQQVNGKVIGHSTALLRYVGKVGDLYPEDAFDALKVDEVVMAGEDFFGLIFKAFGAPPEKQASESMENCFHSLFV